MTKKTVTWRILLDEEGEQVATLEAVQGFPKDTVETHFVLIGMLENLKALHQRKLEILLSKSSSDGSGKEKYEEEDA